MSQKSKAQSGCNFQSGEDISFMVTGQTDVNQTFVLTNAAGIIQYSTTSLPITGVADGQYNAYTIEYENTGTPPDLSVGQDVNNLSGTACTDISDALPLGVCDCNNTTGTLSFTTSNATAGSDFTEVFVLTDATGLIINTYSSGPVTGLLDGIYNIYSVVYDNTDTPPTLTTGTSIFNIGGACVDVSVPLGYVVCLPCFEIEESITDRSICHGENVDTIAAVTTFENPDSIAFVYFISAQTDSSIIYTGGIGIDTVQIAAANDTVSITDVAGFTNTGSGTQQYFVYVIAHPIPVSDDCRPYEEIIINVKSVPTLEVADVAICEGETATITAIVGNTGSKPTFYTWSIPNGEANPGNVASFTATTAGVYTVTATNNGCSVSDSGTLTVHDLPVVSTINADICEGLSIDLSTLVTNVNNTANVDTAYFLTMQNAIDSTNEIASLVSPTATRDYYIRLSTQTNPSCYDVESLTITVNNIMTTISTTCNDNGTGGNVNDDTFTITVNATNDNPGASGEYLVIYNGTTLNIGGTSYGQEVIVNHPDFAANGVFSPTLTIQDTDDVGCEVMTTVAAVANCSNCPPIICLPAKIVIKRGNRTN